jgi:hypothetical protein
MICAWPLTPTYVEVKVQIYRISGATEKSALMKLNLKLVSFLKRSCAKNCLRANKNHSILMKSKKIWTKCTEMQDNYIYIYRERETERALSIG